MLNRVTWECIKPHSKNRQSEKILRAPRLTPILGCFFFFGLPQWAHCSFATLNNVFISCAGRYPFRHPIQFLTDSYDFQISCGSRSMGSGSPRPRGGNYPGNLGARLLYLNIKFIHPIFCSPKPWQLTIPRPTHATPNLGELNPFWLGQLMGELGCPVKCSCTDIVQGPWASTTFSICHVVWYTR